MYFLWLLFFIESCMHAFGHMPTGCSDRTEREHRKDELSLLHCVRRNKLPRWKGATWDPAARFWGLLGLRGSKSPMLLCPLKMQSVFGTREVPVKRTSSRKRVIFILLMSYFSRQACLRESQLPEDKPPSHHFLTWVTYLNNITHSLVYFLFKKKLFFFNAVNPKPSITIESVNSLQIFSHFPPKAL